MSTPIFDEKTIKVAIALLHKKEDNFFETMDTLMTPFKEIMSEEDNEMYDAVKLVVKTYASSCRDALGVMIDFKEQDLEESDDKNQMTIDEFLQ